MEAIVKNMVVIVMVIIPILFLILATVLFTGIFYLVLWFRLDAPASSVANGTAAC